MLMSSREVPRRLKDDGWFRDRQSGSHVQLRHPTKPGTVTVPHPEKDIPIGTLKSISKQSGVPLP
jgi:predicted RNA binding protein YcfA (HicA-like mRNA interferase family)